MELENFSVSLAVREIQASKLFYEKLSFTLSQEIIAELTDYEEGERNVGLLQGMFDKNILTFNPGWTSDAQPHFDLGLVFPVQKMKGD